MEQFHKLGASSVRKTISELKVYVR